MIRKFATWLSAAVMLGALAVGVQAQANISPLAKAAQSAFLAWEKGEKTGNYADFKAVLSPDFNLFSHPVQPARGVFQSTKAKEMMMQLIEQRSQTPNQLTFANVRQHQSQNSSMFEFDSEGKVAGYPYKGWNAIQITMGSVSKVVSFREYLGDIDPAWFQKR